MSLKSKKVGVLLGGLSAEKEVSAKTGEAITVALLERGYDAHPIYARRDLGRQLAEANIEIAFIALHGKYGEDGCAQGVLELLGIPYTGSDVLASALAMHKVRAKELFRLHNLATPSYYVVTRDNLSSVCERHEGFGFPVVVKPACEGSSVGVTIVRHMRELRAALELALSDDREALVERFIAGSEVSVAVLDGRALGAVEIEPAGGFYDYDAKYRSDETRYHLPPRVSATRYDNLLTLAERAHQSVGCSGVSRVDLRVSARGNEYLLEVNTLPGLTTASLVPKIAEAAGLSFGDLVERILFGAQLRGARVFARPAHLEELVPSLKFAAA